jgi:hypothetical protein
MLCSANIAKNNFFYRNHNYLLDKDCKITSKSHPKVNCVFSVFIIVLYWLWTRTIKSMSHWVIIIIALNYSIIELRLIENNFRRPLFPMNILSEDVLDGQGHCNEVEGWLTFGSCQDYHNWVANFLCQGCSWRSLLWHWKM